MEILCDCGTQALHWKHIFLSQARKCICLVLYLQDQQQILRAPAPNGVAVELEVQRIVHGVLGSAVSSDQPLMEAGLDSLGAVEVRTSLERAFDIDLPATITFDCKTFLHTKNSCQCVHTNSLLKTPCTMFRAGKEISCHFGVWVICI